MRCGPSGAVCSEGFLKFFSSSSDFSAAWTHYETPNTGRRDRLVVDRGGWLTCRRSLCFLLLSWMRLASSVASSWVVIFGYPGHVSAHW